MIRLNTTQVLRWLGMGLLFVFGFGGLIVAVAWLTGAFQTKLSPGYQAAAERQLGDQPTDVVRNVTKPNIQEAVGTVRARSRTAISAKVLATIESVLVTAGDEVEAGDVLIELDSDEFQARLRQAEQALSGAVATREEAQLDFDRMASLVQKQAAARSDYDKAVRQLRVAEADEARARQAIAEAEVMLSYTTLRAPKPGRIVDRLAEPGDTASPGVPLLVIYDPSSLRLEAPVQAQLAVQLNVGETLQAYIDALDTTLEATIDEIVPQADAPSRSFLVKANLPTTDRLYEGMFGRLRVPMGERTHLCVAQDAVESIGQLEYVDVVRDDGTLQRRYVQTGRIGEPGRVEVLSGLDAGERVVLHP
jgi:RND family efflux transporter MFP subunit